MSYRTTTARDAIRAESPDACAELDRLEKAHDHDPPRKVNLCLPGACMTVFLRPGDDPRDAAEAVAQRYYVESGGRELEQHEVLAIEGKIRRETAPRKTGLLHVDRADGADGARRRAA